MFRFWVTQCGIHLQEPNWAISRVFLTWFGLPAWSIFFQILFSTGSLFRSGTKVKDLSLVANTVVTCKNRQKIKVISGKQREAKENSREPSNFCLHQQTIETKQALYPDEKKCFILILSDWSIQHKSRAVIIKSCYSHLYHFILQSRLFWISVDHLAAPEDEMRAYLANLFLTPKMMTFLRVWHSLLHFWQNLKWVKNPCKAHLHPNPKKNGWTE